MIWPVKSCRVHVYTCGSYLCDAPRAECIAIPEAFGRLSVVAPADIGATNCFKPRTQWAQPYRLFPRLLGALVNSWTLNLPFEERAIWEGRAKHLSRQSFNSAGGLYVSQMWVSRPASGPTGQWMYR